MFGRNERSMGVKNGTLGRIDSVTAARMAVMLDDGRSVAFDTKDYAAVDHGYAELPHQRITYDKARDALDRVRPNAGRDLGAAFAGDMGLIEHAA